MLCLGLYTSLYAGLNALLEKDLKKLVALSTLSHLGFICVALFSGSLYLSFLHLLSHALFKSLLFISVGEIIVIHSHSQDRRHITFNSNSGLHSSLFIVFSIFNLCGLPFFSGYYSKDLILEITLYSNFSWLLIIIIYVNVFLTFYYTIRIFKSLFNYSNSPSFIMFNIQSPTSSLFISLLGFRGLVVSSAIFWLSPISALYYVNPTLKFLPFLILFLILSLALASNLKLYRFAILSFFGVHSIVYLTSFLSNFNSLFFYIVSSKIFKSFENGVVDNVRNVFLSNLSLSVSNIMYVFISKFTTIFLTYFFILYLFIALVLGNL
jgi:NADH:ubiquinone oxidoreductase subunit 5 (subunit L)/multisubunit Na+/H+ antiporter MnhA subunit